MIEKEKYSLKEHNTFGIDASCASFMAYGNVVEARQVAARIREAALFLIIGSGSNLLLTHDFEGIVVTPESRFEVDIVGEEQAYTYLRCWAGTLFDDVIAYAVEHQLYGAENLSLIPGEVGASAVQNIGAYGAEAGDLISEVEAVEIATGKIVVFHHTDCEYGYRQSKFKHSWKNKYLITSVVYRFSKVYNPRLEYGNIRSALREAGIDMPTPQQLRDTIIRIRQAKLPDPKVLGNAGSFFMNPIVGRDKYESLLKTFPQMPHYTIDALHEKIPAGWLIDKCGWKGKTVGRVGVYDKQALVLVNHGQATGSEVLALCREVQRDVFNKFGIEIKPEVNIV
ncbi:UDP-N-acetylmuramate dehydrogenase [Prevotella sp. A2931]|uniref:UDP-N-acetylenolpyruvoylglucosamine reductase n=1 Tax=Prevotella illustrans TaxID=2800387 RepID=A0ABS3M7Q5_9BACT|nr:MULTISPECIES: UDP-N-acetylmuramate dehydrogenase [Prevotella]MBO1364204.1 UDP-N-acetylmuramate dehydrogenase [Prevotella illustrans]PTL25398.1 UDP-N-acetylmuramate dehydrogenase [Prevotella sp. oral taxon 820]